MKVVKHFDFWKFSLSIGTQEIMLGYYPNEFKGVSKSFHVLWNVTNRPLITKFVKWVNNEQN